MFLFAAALAAAVAAIVLWAKKRPVGKAVRTEIPAEIVAEAAVSDEKGDEK